MDKALNDFSKQVFEQAKAQGRYDNNPAIAPLLLHMIGEAIEAHTAFASDNRVDSEDIETLKGLMQSGNTDAFRKYFKATVKSTFEDELADIVLMACSIAGYYGIPLGDHVELKHAYNALRSEHSVANDYDK